MKSLFITNETAKTGSPMVLLSLLKWLQTNQQDIVVHVLPLNGGNLNYEVKKVRYNFYDYVQLLTPKKLTFLERILLKLGLVIKPNLNEVLIKELLERGFKRINKYFIK